MTEIYQKRRALLRERLAARNVAYAVLNNPTNVLYYCGVRYDTHERFMGLRIATDSGETALILPAMEVGRMTDPSIRETPYLDGEDALALTAQGIKAGDVIGIEKDYLHFGRAEALVTTSGGGFKAIQDISDIILAQRLIKDETEVAVLQKAAQMTDELLGIWLACAKAGAKESDMQFEMARLLALTAEADPSFDTIIASGPHTAIAHGIPGERTVQPGEQILVDYGVLHRHYHADITRTFFAGEPKKDLQHLYESVLAANLAGIEQVKPGRPIKEVDLAARRVLTEAGYGEYFSHRTGHGLGLDIHEDPYVRDDNETLLVEGMVFTIEPGAYLPDLGGVRVEDDILVTKDGCRVLTAFPKQLKDMILA